MNIRLLIPFLIVAGVVAFWVRHRSVGHVSGFSTSSFSVGHAPDRSEAFSRPTHQEARRIDDLQRYLKLGNEFERAGQFSKAETYFRSVCLLDHASFHHMHLALLYDRMGREKLALGEYHEVLYGKVGWSSLQTDPRILTRYGDLCAAQGELANAKVAYHQAFEVRQSIGPTEPKPFANGESLGALRSAAHLASALEFGSVGETQKQLAEIETALKADGTNWTVRFYYARELANRKRPGEAQREALAAERLAPKNGVGKVREMKRLHRIL